MKSMVPQDMDESLEMTLDMLGVPTHLQTGLLNYTRFGRPVGGFLEAVISNDLVEATTRADPVSQAALGAIALWLVHSTPAECYGSPERYRNWVKAGVERLAEERRGAASG